MNRAVGIILCLAGVLALTIAGTLVLTRFHYFWSVPDALWVWPPLLVFGGLGFVGWTRGRRLLAT